MTASLKEAVLDALRGVEDPDLHKDLVTLGMVRDLEVDGSGSVKVTICLTTPACPMKEKIKGDCERAIAAVAGVSSYNVTMTAEVRQGAIGEGKTAIPGVRNIIAVGSGKGGVGKSTTAVNLAIALGIMGARVGVLDADLYGPNVPGMLGVSGKPRVIDNRIIPLNTQWGITCLSMGFMVDADRPLIWRGPMLHGALRQLLFDVAWGQLDYLVIDLPPGTGDVQLTLAQSVPGTTSVIVTTPQNVALQDAKRGVAMFREVKVPIGGIIENMAYYLCPKCGHRDEIFDSSGGENAAARLGVPFLGRIPLVTEIREGMDVGRPIATVTDSPLAAIYQDIARKVAQQVSLTNAKTGNPFAIIPAVR
jgi:ATP-binding protein involved in chromosome partitioning